MLITVEFWFYQSRPFYHFSWVSIFTVISVAFSKIITIKNLFEKMTWRFPDIPGWLLFFQMKNTAEIRLLRDKLEAACQNIAQIPVYNRSFIHLDGEKLNRPPYKLYPVRPYPILYRVKFTRFFFVWSSKFSYQIENSYWYHGAIFWVLVSWSISTLINKISIEHFCHFRNDF